MKVNPFKPHSPVNPGMFVGRITEIERIEAHMLQTVGGNPSNFMITGERGIGKSSLLNYCRWKAEGGKFVMKKGIVNLLVVDTDLDQNTSRIGLIQKIELALRNKLNETEPARAFMKKTWDFISRIETGAIKIGKKNGLQMEETTIEEFAYSLADVVERVTSADAQTTFNAKYDGVLILIDEVDNSSPSLDLGSFFKLLLERLNRRGCDKLMVGLAGLPNLMKVLHSSHPSSLRLFDNLRIGRLTCEEVSIVIDFALERAEETNGVKCDISEEARGQLVALSEGYPHFIQQFGFSAFESDDDDNIDVDDVEAGSWGEFGAMEAIGDRYYRDDFYNKIQKDSYRQVLRIMADNLDGWVNRSEIKASFKGNDSVLNNAVKALRDRKIIISKEGERGVYRLQHKGFAYWIKLFTSEGLRRPA